MIKYKARIIENNSHGNLGGSNLIKTMSLPPVIPPIIGCMPFGMASIDLFALIGQLESDYGPQSESYSAEPRSMGDLESPSPSITLSVNNAPFKTLNLFNPYDLPLILQYGGDPYNAPPPEGIDGRTIITISSALATSMSFVLGIALLEMMAQVGLDEAIAAYADIFGYPPDIEDQFAPSYFKGLGTDGMLVGTTTNWNVLDIARESDIGFDYGDFIIVNKETKVTYRRSGLFGDTYDTIFGNPDSEEITLTSCSSLKSPALSNTYTCVPTVKEFTPTVKIYMNDTKGALVLRIKYTEHSLNSDGMPETVTTIRHCILTTVIEDTAFYDSSVFPNADVYVVDELESAVNIFKMMFGVTNDEYDNTELPAPFDPNDPSTDFGYEATNKLYRVSAIGTGMTAHLLSSYDDTTGVAAICGIFDETATNPRDEYNRFQQLKSYVPTYVSAYPSETTITLEKVDSVVKPYYAKCYVTEQFGEEVVIQSCLGVGCSRGYS